MFETRKVKHSTASVVKKFQDQSHMRVSKNGEYHISILKVNLMDDDKPWHVYDNI